MKSVKQEKTEVESDTDSFKRIAVDSLPNWMNGTWVNLAESNLNKVESFHFKSNEIEISKGMNVLNNSRFKTYSGEAKSLSDSVFQVEYFEKNKRYELEFKFKQPNWTEDICFSYSVKENGVVKRKHTNSIQFVFSKVN